MALPLKLSTTRQVLSNAPATNDSTCAWHPNCCEPKPEVKPNRKERRKQLALARKRGRT